MPTPKQIEASRANGARSRGPVTAQGKLNSSRNSLRHGLLSRTVVLEEENPRRFSELLTALLDEFQPRTSTELMLVETMAVARWRLLRIWGMQKSAIDREMALQDPSLGPAPVRALAAFRTSPDASCSPELLLRYEIAFDRQFNRALIRLTALQSKPAVTPPVPYHPEFPSGQTWQQSHVASERTQQIVETEPPLPTEPRSSGSGLPFNPARINQLQPHQATQDGVRNRSVQGNHLKPPLAVGATKAARG